MRNSGGKARIGAIAILSAAAFAIMAAAGLTVSRASLNTLSAWPMFHYNLAHTGLSPNNTSSNPGTLKWSSATTGIVFSSPAISADGSTIYVGSEDGNLYAFNYADGSPKWAFPSLTSGAFESSPAIGTDGTIYVGSDDGNLYAITDGGQSSVTEKWAFPSPTLGAFESSPAIGTDGTIYVGSDDGNLYALTDGGSGSVTKKWAFPSPTSGAFGSSPAVGTDGTIYVGSDDGYLYAITDNGSSPSQPWPALALGTASTSSPAISPDGTTIYMTSWVDNLLYSISADGKVNWAFNLTVTSISSPAISADGTTIYVGSNDSRNDLYAVNSNGTKKWAFPTGGLVDSSPAIGGDGTIYVGSEDKNLYALTDGGQGTVTQKWAFAASDAVDSSPAIGGDGTIYFGSNDKNLYALGCSGCPTPTPTIAPSPTPSPTTAPSPTATSTPRGSIFVPAWLGFYNTPVGDAAATENLTVKNTGNTTVSITGTNVLPNSDEFAITAHTCGSELARLTTCTITIGFTPDGLGTRSATLRINDSAGTGTQNVALGGTGTIDMAVTPASWAFASVKVGSKATRWITVHNYQTIPVSLSEGFSGSNAGDFSVTGGTCTSTLSAKTACTLIVTFAPTAVGTEGPATLTVTDSPDTLGPYTVSFTASATIPESLSAKNLSFGTVAQTASKTKSVTVTNHATGAVTLTGATITGSAYPDDFAIGGTCTTLGGSLAAANSCTYTVTFTPSTETLEGGTLSIGVAEDPTSLSVSLSGTGVTPLRVTPAALAFGSVKKGKASAAKTVTVTNLGSAELTISEGGTSGTDFAVTGGTCSGTLTGGASCTYRLKFEPSIVGPEGATLGVSAFGDGASPHNVSLTGTGS